MKNRKHSVFFYLLVYNMVILLIPMAIHLLGYYQADRMMMDRISENARAMLSQSRRVIDERLLRVREMATSIAMESCVLNYPGQDGAASRYVDEIYGQYQINLVFDQWITVNPYIEELFVYYVDAGSVVVSQDNSETFERFFARRQATFGQDPLLAAQAVRAVYSSCFLPAAPGSDASLCYVQNVPFTRKGPEYDKLVISLSRGIIGDALPADPSSGTALILNSRGQTVYCSGDAALAGSLSYEQLSGRSESFQTTVEGEECIILHAPSEQADWQYVYAVPLSEYMQPARNLRLITVLLTAFGFLAGAGLCWYFAYKSFQPVKQISSQLDIDLSGNIGDPERNEWDVIGHALNQYRSSTKRYREDLDIHRSLLRASALRRLLYQDLSASRQGRRLLEQAQLSFSYRRFVCAVLELRALPEELNDLPHESLQALLLSVAADIGQTTGAVYLTDGDTNDFCCILNLADRYTDVQQECGSFFAMLWRALAEFLSIGAAISVGGVHEGLCGISQSFSEACRTQDYHQLTGEAQVVFWEELPGIHPRYYYPIPVELQLLGALRQGESARVSGTLREIFEHNFSGGRLSVETAKCLIFELMSTALKAAEETGLRMDDILEDNSILYELMQGRSFETMAETLQGIFGRICELVQQKQLGRNQEKIQAITGYMQDKLSDPTLSLSMIADHFQMNPTYLSCFFREQMGESFVGYVRGLKTERAKKLLLSTRDPLNKIADALGYSNSNVFIRNFKKETGMTPSAFRSQQGDSENF